MIISEVLSICVPLYLIIFMLCFIVYKLLKEGMFKINNQVNSDDEFTDNIFIKPNTNIEENTSNNDTFKFIKTGMEEICGVWWCTTDYITDSKEKELIRNLIKKIENFYELRDSESEFEIEAE